VDDREEITIVAAQMKLEELEISAKKPCILAPQKEADVKKIDLGTGDPEKIATISTHLSDNRNSRSPTFFGTTKISSLGSRPTCQVS
jgi:hypothetical protein